MARSTRRTRVGGVRGITPSGSRGRERMRERVDPLVEPAGMRIAIGQRFAGYELKGVVEASRTGVVYKARDLRLQRTVALRLVAPDIARDPVTRARLNRESTALAQVDHPNVVPIYEVGEHAGRLFIASRWVDGSRLSALVRHEGPLAPKRAVRIVNQVAWALQAAHALGIIHRHVNPPSVLVTPAEHAYLTDFGYARHFDDSMLLTLHDRLPQEADYAAPEYVGGEAVDSRTDIYGLGCVLYEALTGEVPYPQAGAAAKTYAHRFAEPPSAHRRRSEVPEAVDAVIARAMAKDPDERQQSAGEFAIEATGAIHLSAPPWATMPGPSTEHANAGVPAPDAAEDQYYEPVYFTARARRSRRWLVLTLLVLLVLVAVPVVLLLLGVTDHHSGTAWTHAAKTASSI